MEDPHVSPDGKNVTIIEGLMSDAGVTGGDILVVPINGPINGGMARNITPRLKASPFSIAALTSPDRHRFRRKRRWEFWLRQREHHRRRGPRRRGPAKK